MKDIVCTFWEVPCRFCSEESTYCACTHIKKQDGHYIPIKIGYIKSERGQYCNNIGCFIKDIKYCPARYALTSGNGHPVREEEKPKRKYTKKIPVVEKPKRKYVKKMPIAPKKKPVVKKSKTPISKRKKEIINI